jgi:dCMP deaminase
MLIGLTGRNAAGKGEVARYLRAKSFYYFSLSDILREEIRSRGQQPTRELLIAAGNELRRQYGSGVLADRTLRKLEPDRNYVIDSIRNPSEVAAFRSSKHPFKLVFIDAPLEIRFARAVGRAREGEPLDIEKFKEIESREESGDMHSQNLKNVEALADCHLINDGSVEQLGERLDELVRIFSSEVKRPGWDEYFMNMAKVAASRSNCMKRKVAAIIIRDKRIISTGYNGTPRGTRNCNEGGCPRCNNMAASGTSLDECLCSHGEENAIVQASYHGVSLKDAIIYTTFAPCLMCAKMIINAGIREVVFNAEYPLNESAFKLFGEAGVVTRQITG